VIEGGYDASVNLRDLPAISAFAAAEGVERIDVVPHRPVARAPLSKSARTSISRAEKAEGVLHQPHFLF
jgi:hypothetical protein